MAHYRVSHASSHNVTLEDAAGRRHVAYALHDTLPVGAEFHGPSPVRGFAILSNASTHRMCRVIFERINCSPDEALSG